MRTTSSGRDRGHAARPRQGGGVGEEHTRSAAPAGAAAAAAAARPGGPRPAVTGTRRTGPFRREPVTVELGPAWPEFTTRGREPTVLMGTPPAGDLARAAAAGDHRPYCHWQP